MSATLTRTGLSSTVDTMRQKEDFCLCKFHSKRQIIYYQQTWLVITLSNAYAYSPMNIDINRVLSTFSSRRHQFLIYPDTHPELLGVRLSAMLHYFLPEISPSSWPKRIRFGGAHINGVRVTEDIVIELPCKLEYFETIDPIETYQQQFPKWSTDWICYEDEELIVVTKPAGLPTFPSREQKQYSLRRYVDDYLGHPAHFPSRIDTSTSGLVIASKSDKMHATLQQSFEKRRIEKSYLLATHQQPPWPSVSFRGNITKSELHPVLQTVSLTSGKSAQTTVWVLGQYKDLAVMLARPLSGRTHQIRVHLATAGLPLVGDTFYGGRDAESLHLMCFRLRFADPRTGSVREFTVPDSRCPEWVLPFLNRLAS
jgi:RluA family pseudouridine synthase